LLTKINLVWGSQAYFYDKLTSTDETIADVEDTLKKDGHVKTGDIIIILASMPIQEKARTNTLKINIVK
jgi:pyruvate kinase